MLKVPRATFVTFSVFALGLAGLAARDWDAPAGTGGQSTHVSVGSHAGPSAVQPNPVAVLFNPGLAAKN